MYKLVIEAERGRKALAGPLPDVVLVCEGASLKSIVQLIRCCTGVDSYGVEVVPKPSLIKGSQ
jgi:hypothetical protein